MISKALAHKRRDTPFLEQATRTKYFLWIDPVRDKCPIYEHPLSPIEEDGLTKLDPKETNYQAMSSEHTKISCEQAFDLNRIVNRELYYFRVYIFTGDKEVIALGETLRASRP